MNGHATPGLTTGRQAIVTGILAAAFLWTIALGFSGELHARVHSDSNQAEHSCAVTYVASGSYDHAVQVARVAAAIEIDRFSKIPALTPQWVESPFLGASIFEHAPPAHS